MRFRLMVMLFIAAQLLPLSLAAEDLFIADRKFSPEKFHVGDPVVLEVTILNKQQRALSLPKEIESDKAFLLDDIRLESDQEETLITIRFRSFSPGSGSTPRISLGEGELSPISFYTTPLLKLGDKDIYPVRQQAMLPGSKLYTSLLILGILILPVFLYIFIRFSIKYIVLLIRKYMKTRPLRKFSKVLKKLDTSLQKMGEKDFYSTLTEGLKEYLSTRIPHDLTTATTGEISRMEFPVLDQQHKKLLLRLLKKSDLIKFAGESATLLERQNSLKTVSDLCNTIESSQKKQESEHADV